MTSYDDKMLKLRKELPQGSDDVSEQEVRNLAEDIGKRDKDRRRSEYLHKVASGTASGIKTLGTAVSALPVDAGIGDLIYAGGELLDPEGDAKMAALSAGVGLATGGVGSGALTARAAKRLPPYDPEKAKDLIDQIIKDLPKQKIPVKHKRLKELLQDVAESINAQDTPATPMMLLMDLAETPAGAELRPYLEKAGVLKELETEKS